MKLSFLFGSGADTSACEDLMSGQEFAKSLIENEYKKQIQEITKVNAAHFQLLYSTSTKIFVQTIAEHEDEAKKIFDKETVEKFVQYYKKDTEKEDNVEITVDYQEDIKHKCKEWYCLLTNKEINKDDIKDFFMKNAVFLDSLDEKFNSLRKVPYNSNAKRVINAYLTIFLILFNCLYEITPDFRWSYEAIYEKLNQTYDTKLSNKSYYTLLKESRLDYEIITTNYTEIAHLQTQKEKITYLHGKLTWFEDLEKLTVYDCTVETERKKLLQAENIIPFILIPSGVKPLICRRQVEQFAEFIKKLQSSRYLVIVGYKFNSEDNHVNSIIADWLRIPERKLIYLNYEGQLKFSEFAWAKEFPVKKLQDLSYSKNFMGDEKILDIYTNKENCLNVFEKILEELQEI